jgi:hypothetical protein
MDPVELENDATLGRIFAIMVVLLMLLAPLLVASIGH